MTNINLKNIERRQQLYGFGTSSCWWSQNISSPDVAEYLKNELYSKEGLGLNIYRYNIGAGYNPDNCRIKNQWHKTESFYIYDYKNESEGYHGGGYDFSRDKNAYNFMKLCLASGNIDTVILFANSPHYSFTSSGQSSGSLMHHTCNLPFSNFKRYVDYFLDITEYFINDGIPVKFISPVNEPQWCWGGRHVHQEGCHYEPDELTLIFHLFADEIEKRKINVKLYGPESGEISGLTETYFNNFKKDKLILDKLGAFAIHSYHADDDNSVRESFYNNVIAKNPNIRFDMSEWCELPCKHKTDSVKGALINANVIGNDLTLLGANSWSSWVAVNQYGKRKNRNGDYSDGLFSANNDISEYYKTKRYYALKHFSYFLPAGTYVNKIKDCQTEKEMNIFSFTTSENEHVLIMVNSGKAKEVNILSDFNFEEIYSTCPKSSFVKDYTGQFQNVTHIKANSITTVKLWK